MKMIPIPHSNSVNLPTPIAITGAGGMLATDLAEIFSELCGKENVFAYSIEQLDITDEKMVFDTLMSQKPRLLINAAAYTNVDKAETERELAYAINITGTEHLARVARELDIPLVHFSTDQVFDGPKNIPWEETDEAQPANYYAQTKFEGEKHVLQSQQNLVLRIQWLYGKQKDRFTPLKNKDTFTPFSDQWGAPTWTLDVSKVLVHLLEKNVNKNVSGLFHFSYDDSASWAEVYAFVKEVLGLSTQLIPKETDSLKLPARRPKYAVLSNAKLLKTLGWEKMGSWKGSLRTFLLRNE